MKMKTYVCSVVFFLFLVCSTNASIGFLSGPPDYDLLYSGIIPYDDIIKSGIEACRDTLSGVDARFSSESHSILESWYLNHPFISSVSCIEKTMTVNFIDGYSIVLFDAISTIDDTQGNDTSVECFPFLSPHHTSSPKPTGMTAILLNPSEYVYGHWQCQRIMNILMKKGYNIVYKANQDVDISFLRHNLTADILYMNTHAGYWDVDGDENSSMVIIATGEDWTNDTPQQYQFEYENHLIVEGIVGQRSIIAFTPGFIEYYYHEGDFHESLIYMATCYASYDDSMAQAFLAAGADVYIGWTKNTVFWTNSGSSVHAFRLFAAGCSVKLACFLIRSGGFSNWVLGSKLVYFGEGTHTIPR